MSTSPGAPNRPTRSGTVFPPCPEIEKHTKAPEGYLQWHDWAERMSKTHRQVRCPVCKLYAIWIPKKEGASVSAPIASQAEWPDWKYVEAALKLYREHPGDHWEQPHRSLVREILRVRELARKMDTLLDGWYVKGENEWRWNSLSRDVDDILYPKVPREEVQKFATTDPPPLAGEPTRS